MDDDNNNNDSMSYAEHQLQIDGYQSENLAKEAYLITVILNDAHYNISITLSNSKFSNSLVFELYCFDFHGHHMITINKCSFTEIPVQSQTLVWCTLTSTADIKQCLIRYTSVTVISATIRLQRKEPYWSFGLTHN